MPNKYSELVPTDSVEVEKPLTTDSSSSLGAKTSKKNPYSSAVSLVQQEEDVKVRSALQESSTSNPDQYAKYVDLSGRTGLPLELIERNFDQVNKMASDNRYLEVIKGAPKTRSFLIDSENVKLAKDDIEYLTGLEWILKAPQEAFKQGQKDVTAGELGFRSMFGDLSPEDQLRLREAENLPSSQFGADGWFSKALVESSRMLPYMFESFASGIYTGLQGATTFAGGAAILGQLGPQVGTPEEIVTVPGAALTGFGVGSRIGAAQKTFEIEAGHAYNEFLQFQDETGTPLDKDTARTAALVVGGLNAGLEVFALETLVKSFPGGKKFLGALTKDNVKTALKVPAVRSALTNFAKNYAGVVTAETAVEIAQEAVTIIGGELAKQFSPGDFEAATPEELLKRMQDVTVASAQAMSLISLPGPGITFISDSAKAQKAKRNQVLLEGIGNNAKNSKLNLRNPDRYEAFVKDAKVDGSVQNVFVSPENFVEYFQSQNIDPQKMAEDLGIKDELRQAAEAGNDLAIPIEKYMSKLAGTDHHLGLSKILKLDSNDMTLLEAEEFDKNKPELVKKMIQDLQVEQQRLSEDSIRPEHLEKIREQLVLSKEDGGFGLKAEEADSQADLFLAAARTLSKEAGETIDQWFTRVNPVLNIGQRIAQGEQELLQKRPSQTGLDTGFWVLPNGTVKELGKVAGISRSHIGELSRNRENFGIKSTSSGDALFSEALANGAIRIRKDGDRFFVNSENLTRSVVQKVQEIIEDNGFEINTIFYEPRDLSKSLQFTKEEFANFEEGSVLSFRQDEKGSIQFASGQTIINLFKSADRSTFLHESGHLFMSEMRKIVDSGKASEQLKKDYETLSKFAGDINTVEGQEKLAKAFENYLREGKAPTVSLTEAFQRFRRWLTAIYKSAVGAGIEINDDIRQVFDRLLASEQEIEEARRFYSATKFLEDLLPVTPAQKTKLKLAREKTQEAQLDQQVKKYLNAYLEANGGLKAIRQQAENEINDSLVYKAVDELSKQGGLSLKALKAVYTKEQIEKIRNTFPGLLKQDGKKTLAQAAATYQFESPEAFVAELLGALKKSEAVDARAKEILLQKEQEIRSGLISDEKITGEEALHADQNLTYLLAELEVLSGTVERLANRRPSILEARAYREAARTLINSKKVKEATRYDVFAKAEQKYSRLALAAAESGDLNAAFDYKRKQILNHVLVQEAIKARDQKLAIEKYFKPKNLKSKLNSVENSFLDPVLDLVSAFKLSSGEGLEPKNPGAIQNLKELDPVLFAQTPEWIIQKNVGPGVNDYRDLTFSRFVELADSIKSIISYGSDQMKSVEAGEMQTIREWADASILEMEKLKDLTDSKLNELRQDVSAAHKPVAFIDGFTSGATMVQFLSDWMDNFKFTRDREFGPFRRLYKKTVDAETQFYELREKVMNQAKDAWETLGVAAQRLVETHGKKGINVPGVAIPEGFALTGRKYWNPDRLIALILNSGNEGNLMALAKSFGFTEGQIQEVAKLFTEKELKAIQKIWDASDLLFSDTDKTHFEIYNRHIEKVQAKEISFQSSDGKTVKLEGGYYPLVFDHELNNRAAEFFEDDLMKNQTQAVIRSTKPEDGFAYSRTPGHSLPPLLKTSVWFSHVDNVARYISHAKILRDLNRFTKDADWQRVFKKKAGNDHYSALRKWLQYNANPGRRLLNSAHDRAFEWLRSASTALILGFKFGVGIRQRTSMINSAQALGKGNNVKAWKEILSAMHDTGFKTAALGLSKTQAWQEILDKSKYMKTRDGRIDREINDIVSKMDPFEKKLKIGDRYFTKKDFQDFGFEWIKMNDRAVVSVIWKAAYNQYMRKNGDTAFTMAELDQKAVDYADAIIQESQESSLKTELSDLQRSEGMIRLFTQFMSFTLKYGNRVMHNYKAWKSGAITSKEFYSHVLNETVAEPWTALALSSILLSGDVPEWWEWLAEPFHTLIGWIPFLRDASSYIKYGKDFGSTPVGEAPKRVVKGAESIVKFLQGDDSFWEMAWHVGRASEAYFKVSPLNVVRDIQKLVERMED